MASLVPNFEPPNPQEEIEVLKGEDIQMTELNPGSDFHFIFLVDRSGSMDMFNRIQSAKQALTLFIKSLPEGCRFSIISFGSRFSYLNLCSMNQNVIAYNDESSTLA